MQKRFNIATLLIITLVGCDSSGNGGQLNRLLQECGKIPSWQRRPALFNQIYENNLFFENQSTTSIFNVLANTKPAHRDSLVRVYLNSVGWKLLGSMPQENNRIDSLIMDKYGTNYVCNDNTGKPYEKLTAAYLLSLQDQPDDEAVHIIRMLINGTVGESILAPEFEKAYRAFIAK